MGSAGAPVTASRRECARRAGNCRREATKSGAKRDPNWPSIAAGRASSAPTADARLVDGDGVGPGTGHMRLGHAIAYGDVPRVDVAAVLAELAHRPTVRREILELTVGTTPIPDAVTRIDTMRTADPRRCDCQWVRTAGAARPVGWRQRESAGAGEEPTRDGTCDRAHSASSRIRRSDGVSVPRCRRSTSSPARPAVRARPGSTAGRPRRGDGTPCTRFDAGGHHACPRGGIPRRPETLRTND